MRVIVDRIEDGIATLELCDGTLVNVPAQLFKDCKEGDVVDIVPNTAETKRIKGEIEIDISKLFDN